MTHQTTSSLAYPPLIFNIFKPAKLSSQNAVRHFKYHLPRGYGKIGHFGTLDPFASGVLLIGVAGAARLNDLIHSHLPKTYLAVGKLGIKTNTGDNEGEILQRDESLYLNDTIKSFDKNFLQETLEQKFVGDYWQAPHAFSAAKFMGRALHVWAREGQEIKKEPVLRKIYKLEIVKYSFPYLSFKVTVSSGTYVRVLFEDMANWLGTLGSLIALHRQSIGGINFAQGLHKKDWPERGKDWNPMDYGIPVEQALAFPTRILSEEDAKLLKNGGFLSYGENEYQVNQHLWIKNEQKLLLGLGIVKDQRIRPFINFSAET